MVEGATSAGAVIEGNGIGADQPNTADGILLGNEAVDVSIGGDGSAGNIIHSNAGAGIAVFGPSTPANGIEILGNSIYLNGGLGIDLGSDGVTPNDAGDGDSGPNDLLNFPVLTSAVSTGGLLDLQGTVGTDAGTGDYRIDIYRSTTCNAGAPLDYGEGETFLGSQTRTAVNTGGFGFSNSGVLSASPGTFITTTVSFNGKTSEFSQCIVVTAGGGGSGFEVTNINDSGAGSLRQALIDANAQAGTQTITFNIGTPEIGPKNITLLTPLPMITDPVTIGGTSQPGYPTGRVQLVGTGLGAESTGLILGTGSSPTTIIGLGIRDFDIGIQIQDGSGINTIGGDQSTGNVIWEFTDAGIALIGAGTGNVVSGNTIGLSPAGVPSPSAGEAIDISSTTGTVIGDSAAPGAPSADGNRGNILGGAAVGIRLGPGANSNGMAANYVGVTRIGATPTSLGAGVLVNGGSGNAIGPFNLIASTGGVGVQVSSGSGNRIVANEIRDNGGKGIVLGAGANGGLPAPQLDATATRLGTTTTISGDIFGAPPNTPLFIEFFTNAACDTPSNTGEGRTYIFFTGPTTNVDGFASFTFTSDAPALGEVVTATATNAFTNDTSEFSTCASVVAGGGGGGVVLDAVQASVPSTGRVPLASIPGSALVARPAGSTEASPIRDIPIRDIPIRDIPIRDIPIADIPIRDIGFVDGNVLPLLSSFSLSELPLLQPAGGWPAVLVGSPLATAPPQNVTLRDVLALNLPALANLSLADLDLSRTSLGRVPAVAVVLGAVPLGQLELPGGVRTGVSSPAPASPARAPATCSRSRSRARRSRTSRSRTSRSGTSRSRTSRSRTFRSGTSRSRTFRSGTSRSRTSRSRTSRSPTS